MSEILWQPTQEFISETNLEDYIKWLETEKSLSFDSYDALWIWSIEDISAFWESLLDYFEIISDGQYQKVLSQRDMPGVMWFEGLRLNYAEHIFRYKSAQETALTFINECGLTDISWAKLEAGVASMRSFLIDRGVSKGDRVAAFMPNIPETIIAFLAVNSLGAIWSCCSPDFGVDTVVERFSQIEPKILIAVDGYQYNGKPYSKLDTIEEIRKKLPTIESVVLCPYLDKKATLPNTYNWHDLKHEFATDEALEFERVDFNHPIWVLYSSGTTGKPKAITHSHGGMLIEHLKYMHFHNDVKPGENYFWFTTTGWMMWNFLQASLLAGATAVLYDGSPAKPSLEVLWEWTEKLPIHHFGTSAPYLTACMKQNLRINSKYDMSSLRSIGSTGAPLPPEAFDWIYSDVSKKVWLCSMSGGTDVCTAFVGGNPFKEVVRGRIQCRALGCALYAYDEEAKPTYNGLGEMVLEQPMPSMPVFFWNDQGGQRYKSSYFEKFPGKWCHGDWIRIYKDGSLVIHGRSDATLNRKGIRIGAAEIYAVLDRMKEVKDCIVINIEKEGGDDVMPLFLVLNEVYSLDSNLISDIQLALRKNCSPRHVPDLIFEVKEVPYTLSGKKMEVPLKKFFMSMDISNVLNKDAMRNPECFSEYAVFLSELT